MSVCFENVKKDGWHLLLFLWLSRRIIRIPSPLAHPFGACPRRMRFDVLRLGVPTPVPFGFACLRPTKPKGTGRFASAVSTPKQGTIPSSFGSMDFSLPIPLDAFVPLSDD